MADTGGMKEWTQSRVVSTLLSAQLVWFEPCSTDKFGLVGNSAPVSTLSLSMKGFLVLGRWHDFSDCPDIILFVHSQYIFQYVIQRDNYLCKFSQYSMMMMTIFELILS